MEKVIIKSGLSILLLAIIAILIYVFTYEEIIVTNVYANYSQKEYMELADLVVAVEVIKNVETKYTNPDFTIKSALNENEPARNVLVTYSLVKIKDVIKGDVTVNDKVLIREFGGQYGNTTTIVDETEVVKPGEEYVMFLFRDNSDIADKTKDYYELANPYRSKFQYDKSTKLYVNVNDKSRQLTIEDFKTMNNENKM